MTDVYAYTPRFEGLPNAVLEAMATGLPVAATNVGGISEAVVDGVTGRLVAPGDVDGLAAAILGYCEDARARATHGAAGRARAVAEFKPDVMRAAYIHVYEAALAARGLASSRFVAESAGPTEPRAPKPEPGFPRES
jgi:glycosyltransferase involved in cell wall biosynthesis